MYFVFLRYLSTQFNNAGFVTLMVLFVADVLLGVTLACMRKSDNTLNKRLESRQLLKGVYKKIGMVLVYLLGCAISFFTNENTVVYLTLAGLIAHEGISVLENLAMLDIPIPKKLKDMLEVLKGDSKNDKE